MTINHIEYAVEARDPREAIEARGLDHVAARMRTDRIAANLILRRPRGRVTFFAVEYEDGRVEVRTRIN